MNRNGNKNRIYLIFIAVLFTALSLSGCFTDWRGEGVLTISLGGNSRNVTPDEEILKNLNYEITLSGSGERIVFSARSGEQIKRTLAAGRWNVKLDAYLEQEGEEKPIPYATGENSVDVKAGQSNSVTVKMTINEPDAEYPSDATEHYVATVAEWDNAVNEIKNTHSSSGTHAIILTADIAIPALTGRENYTFGTTADSNTLEVYIVGNKKISLDSARNVGPLLYIDANQTVVLNGPTLKGKESNDTAVVSIINGTFIMESGTITGNTGNTKNDFTGVGVSVGSSGTFTMNGGTITDNTGDYAGGVHVAFSGTFTMNDGTITDNTGTDIPYIDNIHYPGGVYVGGTFTMNSPAIAGIGGSITGNTANGSEMSNVSKYIGTFGPGTIEGSAIGLVSESENGW